MRFAWYFKKSSCVDIGFLYPVKVQNKGKTVRCNPFSSKMLTMKMGDSVSRQVRYSVQAAGFDSGGTTCLIYNRTCEKRCAAERTFREGKVPCFNDGFSRAVKTAETLPPGRCGLEEKTKESRLWK